MERHRIPVSFSGRTTASGAVDEVSITSAGTMTKTWTTEDELPQGDSLDDWDAIAHYGAIDMRRCIDDEVVDYPVGTVVLHVGPRGPSTLWKYYRHAEDWFDVAYYVRVE